MSKVYSFKKTQRIPVSLEVIWDYFSTPDNLETITPGNMHFKTISKFHGDKLYPGQVIEYKLSPFLGIQFYWMTEITHVDDKKFFVDEQRFGPYSLWHHQHHFKEIEGGVEMTDTVHYKVPFWFIGDIANTIFIKKQLEQIFDYRFKKVEELFGRFEDLEM